MEEGKIQGQFIGVLANEWNLSEEAILKGDPRFRWFAGLDIGKLSGQSLKRPRKSERQAMEFVYSAPKSVSIAMQDATSLYFCLLPSFVRRTPRIRLASGHLYYGDFTLLDASIVLAFLCAVFLVSSHFLKYRWKLAGIAAAAGHTAEEPARKREKMRLKQARYRAKKKAGMVA